MSDSQLIAALSVVILELIKIRRTTIKKNKRLWKKTRAVATESLFNELRSEEPPSFINLLSMNGDMFNSLLQKVGSKIQKANTVMRQAIPARVKLEIACRYLATGDSMVALENLYGVSKCTISKFLPEVYQAIYDGLKEFIEVPKTEDEWADIQKGFNDQWKFPNCVGCIDGKHVLIHCAKPTGAGAEYHKYKGAISIVLLAMTDHNCNFTFIDIGNYGNLAEGDIFNKSSLMEALEQNLMNLPKGSVVLGDVTFPLKPYVMRPYPKNEVTRAQCIYNYRHYHARRSVENAFGILAARFPVFKNPIHLQPETAVKLLKATCALHNWIRKTKNEVITMDSLDLESRRIIRGSWRDADRPKGMANFMPTLHRTYSPEARDRRDELARHFLEEGDVVPWVDQTL